MSVSSLVRARLVLLGIVGSGTASGTAWVGLVGGLSDAIDAPQVAIVDRAGLAPLDVHGGTGPTRPGFQVIVRGDRVGYEAAAAKVDEVWLALHRTRFSDFLTVEGASSPAWLGYEADTGRPMWSLNFLTLKEG